MSVFDEFDDKLRNIIEIKKNYYDEACILIFVYLDFLCNFTPKKYNDKRHNRENFIHFIMKYSNQAEILHYIQLDKIVNRSQVSIDIERYLTKYNDQLQEVKNGNELTIDNFLNLEDVSLSDKCLFEKYTLANGLYDLRNFAVHEYRNRISDGFDNGIPVLSYISNIDANQSGWYTLYYPFEFLYEILINCYNNVREIFKGFIEEHFHELLEEE